MAGGIKSEESRRRLAEALRENLKRRKAQARGRAAVPAEDAAGPPDTAPSGERPRTPKPTGKR